MSSAIFSSLTMFSSLPLIHVLTNMSMKGCVNFKVWIHWMMSSSHVNIDLYVGKTLIRQVEGWWSTDFSYQKVCTYNTGMGQYFSYKCSKTTLSTRGSEGANESGSSNRVATVNLKSHFSPQPSDTVIFIVLRAYLNMSMTDGPLRQRGRRAEAAWPFADVAFLPSFSCTHGGG
jgi:hypothetical protein